MEECRKRLERVSRRHLICASIWGWLSMVSALLSYYVGGLHSSEEGIASGVHMGGAVREVLCGVTVLCIAVCFLKIIVYNVSKRRLQAE